MRKKIISVVVFLYTSLAYGQLTVQPSHPVSNKLEDIVQSLVGTGVQVSNITSNQAPGSVLYGTFTEASGQLGIGSGLVMATGNIYNGEGPNDILNPISGIEGLPGDPALSALVGDVTYDACVIEFDLITTSTEIRFNYVFASDEYTDFVGFQYNDVFAFLISGPGITGVQNVALIPGTPTPVTINTVNPWANPAYYRDNTFGNFMQYNGYTTKLQARVDVMPCQVYHLKLAIADVADDLYDSGVFIESGSLSGSEAIILGDGTEKAPDSLKVCAADLPIRLKAGIYDLPDYTWTKDGVDIAFGNKYQEVTEEGWYKVRAYNGGCYWVDSIRILTDPAFSVETTPDTLVCRDEAFPLRVVPDDDALDYTYTWSPSTGLSDPASSAPTAIVSGSAVYQVAVSAGVCSLQRSVIISVVPLIDLQIPTEIEGCEGQELQLQVSGAEMYSWSPVAGLSDPGIANPVATLTNSVVYKIVGSNSCHKDSVDVTITVYSYPEISAYGDTSICYGGTAALVAEYDNRYEYTWVPADGLSNPSVHDPLATPLVSTDYIVSVGNHGCVTKDTVQVQVKEAVEARIILPVLSAAIPWTLAPGNGSAGASEYTWYFSPTDSIQVFEPVRNIDREDYYTIILKARNDIGCTDYDTVRLTAYKLFIPNLMTPNQDGRNDRFEITGLGENFELEVYNRWGDLVYKKSNYRNEWEGEGLTDGLYYFRIYDPYLEQDYKGWVQIIR